MTYQQVPVVHPGIVSVPEYPDTLFIVPAILERTRLGSTVIGLPAFASACHAKKGLEAAVASKLNKMLIAAPVAPKHSR